MKTILVTLLVLGLALAIPRNPGPLGRTTEPWSPKSASFASFSFQQFVTQFGKNYPTVQARVQAEAAFYRNLADILEHNSAGTASWTKGVNQFSDLTAEQFKKINRGYNKTTQAIVRESMPLSPIKAMRAEDLPASVDWRTKGVISPVKDQGQCGSCWAFAATETIEAHVAIGAKSAAPVLSPQNFVSCVKNPQQCGGTGGCEGATAELAFGYVINGTGLAAEADYPYKAADTKCNEKIKKSAKISGFVKLPENDYLSLLTALATVGPISISVDASVWQLYSGGVFTGCPSGSQNVDIDHAVQLVGYGTDSASGLDYWIVRNSWSASWGEAGYIRIQRHSDGDKAKWCATDSSPGDGSGCQGGPTSVTVCGSCGIWYDTCYPTGAVSLV